MGGFTACLAESVNSDPLCPPGQNEKTGPETLCFWAGFLFITVREEGNEAVILGGLSHKGANLVDSGRSVVGDDFVAMFHDCGLVEHGRDGAIFVGGQGNGAFDGFRADVAAANHIMNP